MTSLSSQPVRRSARLASAGCTSASLAKADLQHDQQTQSDASKARPAASKTVLQSAKTQDGRRAKVLPTRQLETELWGLRFQRVAGVDEAGRGPLAGPVVAAACCIPPGITITGIDDSKKLTEGQRQRLYDQLIAHPDIATATQIVEPDVIDDINILQATLLAMRQAVEQLQPSPDFVLVDGNQLPKGFTAKDSRAVIGGDNCCHVIAAASILAKVTRDKLMMQYHAIYPQYGFDKHKGYGTAKHMQALKEVGPCPIHRLSFAPCAAAALSHRQQQAAVSNNLES